MSRESLARAANSSNLEMEEGVIHDADRLAAAASGNQLGGLLLRFRESAQPRWGERIILILSRRLQAKYKLSEVLAIKTAGVALLEFADPHCTACHGAREIVTENLKVTCDACGGSGKQRFTDAWRREQIGTYGRRFAEAIFQCHTWMSASFGAYMSHANARLQ